MNDQELSALFEKLLKNECSEEEADRILALFADKDLDNDLKALIIAQLQQPPAANLNNAVSDDVQKSLDLGLDEILRSNPSQISPKRNILFTKRILYAAAVTLVFISVVFYYFTKQKHIPTLAARPQKQLIVPGSNKAILTLSNGVQINLADASNGEIAKQADISIKKTKSGVLVYEDKAKADSKTANTAGPLLNTITTPKGGQYELVLPDGSKVWLNAASSLKYPAQFTGNERVVELNGEGYFEIMSVQRLNTKSGKAEKMPFIVMNNHQRIEVVGTKFNVNAYTDEEDIKTTLLTGAVKVSVLQQGEKREGNAPVMLSPGQQSTVADNSLNVKAVNTELAVAWKNGVFQFDNEDIKAVMRKIARWYDVEVTYQGNMDGKVFSGTISKYKNVNDVLKMLQFTGSVSFTIKDRKIIVF
ncbi:DUF4974 domain-containing protein [Mucilaginibacter gynuensis]|uniref:DUF4974 domain-containing protein n=1 Tax=Mucilaginibacter gynuensis TaxID=1302236 RepID=A0ABP8G023_9SPHI